MTPSTKPSDKQDKDTITMVNTPPKSLETAKLTSENVPDAFDRDPSQVPSHGRFWSISLTVVELGVEMVINLSDSVLLGRLYAGESDQNFIDLTGYNAHEYGVSRQHAYISLSNNKVVIKDNNSANRTLLNKKKISPMQEYPLRPGDVISLGKLELKFNLLFDPFA
ncbi:MAG: FHA domain-containing protein [Anaerolineae bacterium]